MSIEVNGVTLPDIPSEVLESYPYAVIMYRAFEEDNYTEYAYIAATAPLCDVDDANAGGHKLYSSAELETGVAVPTPAVATAVFGFYAPGYVTEWTGAEEQSLALAYESAGYTLVWANHDIYTCTYDTDYNFTLTDTIYFARNDSDPNYFAPKSWFDGMARQVMRLTGTSEKLTTDEMLEGLKSYEGGTSLADNERIYQVGTAASTLEPGGLFESSAS